MRLGEIFSLKWDCVDFNRGIVTVLKTKNDEFRNIPMNSVLTKELGNVRLHSTSEYVFPRQNGEMHTSIRYGWEKALRKARITGFRFHDLRHTFASNLIIAGADLVTVKELFGHKTIAMTMRFAHLNQEHKKKAVELLGSHNMVTRGDASELRMSASR
jgi:integrase